MKGHNQKILLIVLIVLTATFVMTRLFRSPARESNLDVRSLKVDTSQISEIRLYPTGEQRREIRLIKDDRRWKVNRDNITSRSETYQVNNLLNALAQLKPQRIVTRKSENWDEYEVGDTTGVQVKIFNQDAVLAVLWIGKESAGNTYVRRSDQDEVYAVTGSVLGTFNKPFNDWRDKSFLRLKPDSVLRIEFHYPADSGFVVTKNSTGWTAGDSAADSIKVAQYLARFRARNLYNFVDSAVPGGEPQISIRFSDDKKALAVVNAWKSTDDKLILTSSLQEGVYFSSDPVTTRELFVGKLAFLLANP